MPKRLRVFVDTSALLAGLNSPNGAAGAILAACFSKRLIPVISRQVIEEAERNIEMKFPALHRAWEAFLRIPPELAPDPSLRQIRKVHQILPTSDAPILASALKAHPDALVTWNTRDFLRKEVMLRTPFPIFIPRDFLKQYL
ncbi:MAG: PIN domain-containing protein [bacterium]|nr:PIN domain-containing protein [bacterium]